MKQITILCSLFALALSGCAGVQVSDRPMCRALKPITVKYPDAFGIVVTEERPNPTCMKAIGEGACGFCPYTVSDKQVWVGESKAYWLYDTPWSVLKEQCALVPTQTLAALKEDAMVNCKKYGCGDQNIAKWRIKLDSLSSIGDVIAKP